MADTLDAGAVRRWVRTAADALTGAADEIDALNVFPVADADTGTNLALTMQAVAAAVDTEPPDADLTTVVRALAHGALMGARGNSGVIMSQLLRGVTDELTGRLAVDAEALARGLQTGYRLAYEAVLEPVEGTVLTVARAAAAAAARATVEGPGAVAAAAAAAAATALAATTDQLPVLRQAGVVDAGGRGLVVVLDALHTSLTGTVPPGGVAPAPADVPATGASSYAYEVQYLLDADEAAVEPLRRRLAELGDSVLVVGTGRTWNVHAHVDDAGAAIEAGVDAGRPHRISVTRFDEQTTPDATGQPAVVAVVPGDGLAALFRDSGARVVPAGGDVDPNTVRAAIDGVGPVVVLPNDGAVRAAADEAARQARADGRTVVVIPTRSPVQGLAALAVHDAERTFADDVIAMSAAAGATRFAALAVADQVAQTSAGVCHPGDVLGIVGDDVAVIGHDLADTARGVLDRLLIGGGELVTLVLGAGTDPALGAELSAYVRAARPAVDVSVFRGDQPGQPLLIGVE